MGKFRSLSCDKDSPFRAAVIDPAVQFQRKFTTMPCRAADAAPLITHITRDDAAVAVADAAAAAGCTPQCP